MEEGPSFRDETSSSKKMNSVQIESSFLSGPFHQIKLLPFLVRMTLDDENEDILVQIQEEQRQFPRRFARRLHQVGKRGGGRGLLSDKDKN